jgi:serine/threonine protein kinase
VVELVTGTPPYFELQSMSAMFRIVEDDHPPLPNDISEELKGFLLLCFQKNPIQRPKAAELVNHPFFLKHTSAKAIPRSDGQVDFSVNTAHSGVSDAAAPAGGSQEPKSNTLAPAVKKGKIQRKSGQNANAKPLPPRKASYTESGKSSEVDRCGLTTGTRA